MVVVAVVLLDRKYGIIRTVSQTNKIKQNIAVQEVFEYITGNVSGNK